MQRASSAPVPPHCAPGGSGQPGTPRNDEAGPLGDGKLALAWWLWKARGERPAHWAPKHRLGCSS
eukprot:scaffold597_cov55-Phaeocystis_antarctica.AAC.7